MLTLRAYGFDPDRLADIGVSGLHRLLAHVDRITNADAVVVVAGMEGALASVIGVFGLSWFVATLNVGPNVRHNAAKPAIDLPRARRRRG